MAAFFIALGLGSVLFLGLLGRFAIRALGWST